LSIVSQLCLVCYLILKLWLRQSEPFYRTSIMHITASVSRRLHILSHALVSFKKYMPPSSSLLQGKHLPFSPSPLRLNIFRLRYLWSFRWPNYIITLPRYFSFRLPHLNIPTGPVGIFINQTNWTRIVREHDLVKI
jgi:hypothetical protein